MTLLTQRVVVWRMLMLTLLIVAMVGPWTFDLINVPAQYTCDMPFVRLHGDFCGYPLSGFKTITWVTSGFFYVLADILKGNFAARIAEFVFLICVSFVVFPFFSTLLLIGNRNSRRLQILNVIVLGMACLLTLTMFIFQSNWDQFVRFFSLLWGLWLYILVAIGTIIAEILVLRLGNKSNMTV